MLAYDRVISTDAIADGEDPHHSRAEAHHDRPGADAHIPVLRAEHAKVEHQTSTRSYTARPPRGDR
jgi:hypothetical protein